MLPHCSFSRREQWDPQVVPKNRGDFRPVSPSEPAAQSVGWTLIFLPLKEQEGRRGEEWRVGVD
jgi:hypothetical protein